MNKGFRGPNHRLLIEVAEDLAQHRRLKPYPIKEIEDADNGRDVNLFVKLEHDNTTEMDPARSIKRKPANLMGNFVEELGILANEVGKESSRLYRLEHQLKRLKL